MVNVYRVLGVVPSASFGQLRVAYKAAVRRVHPDVRTGDAKQFRVLQGAWELVATRELRAKYDLDRQSWAERVDAVLCPRCGEGNRLARQPTHFESVLCGGCRSPIPLEKERFGAQVRERNRSLLVEQTCDLIDTVGEEAVLAVGNALAGQIRRLRRRLTGV